jgi:16S rRNA processing protein RimM
LSNKENFFEFGKIIKTRGLRGCLKVFCFTEAIQNFADLEEIFFEGFSEEKQSYHINKLQISGNVLFLELQGIQSLEAAKPLIGRKIYLPKNFLKKLPDGEHYWDDIIGLRVYTDEDQYLGVIVSIFRTGSNDVYVCQGNDREIFLPAIADVILQIDIVRQIMMVKLLQGLEQ